MDDEAIIHVTVSPNFAILLSAFTGRPYGTSVSIGMSPQRARDLAAQLVKGADLIESGAVTKPMMVTK